MKRYQRHTQTVRTKQQRIFCRCSLLLSPTIPSYLAFVLMFNSIPFTVVKISNSELISELLLLLLLFSLQIADYYLPLPEKAIGSSAIQRIKRYS